MESPGLLPATCTTSSACRCFLLQCLRALRRNKPVWPGSEYLALHPQPSHSAASRADPGLRTAPLIIHVPSGGCGSPHCSHGTTPSSRAERGEAKGVSQALQTFYSVSSRGTAGIHQLSLQLVKSVGKDWGIPLWLQDPTPPLPVYKRQLSAAAAASTGFVERTCPCLICCFPIQALAVKIKRNLCHNKPWEHQTCPVHWSQ